MRSRPAMQEEATSTSTRRAATVAAVWVLLSAGVFGDVYLHNPRGSNNRNCERNENRNNGNRLFDSQNNDKGGYACPRAVGGAEVVTGQQYFYSGSVVHVEWSAQHGCGSEEGPAGGESNVRCEVVLQYMCEDGNAGLRDGTPSDANDAATDRMGSGADADNARFGYHETVAEYTACTTRLRNGGLWLADQTVAATRSAAFTRQNPNGARRGWECPEERDYYPYWHPTPWKDIAVLTSDPAQCRADAAAASQNVAPRYACVDLTNAAGPVPQAHNQQAPCEVDGFTWAATPAWGLPAPDCVPAPWSRDNHLGNTRGAYMAAYDWRVPALGAEARCVLRIRYNITAADVPRSLDATRNLARSPVRQDPYVPLGYGYNLSLALNTNQYGRTFQDRSYVFAIRPRPAALPAAANIHNINVAGKRGNIVQTYPAVEYQFSPMALRIAPGDYVHFQWAGSDYNPDRRPNDGEGGPVDPVGNAAQRADRSNVVPAFLQSHVPALLTQSALLSPTRDIEAWKRLAYIAQDMARCLPLPDLLAKNTNNGVLNQAALETDSQNCMKLNAAQTPYFDAGPIQIHAAGSFHYMSSRNNNFSNRSQKGIIISEDSPKDSSIVVAVGASLAVVGAAAFGLGGSYFYAKKNPDSKVALFFDKCKSCRRS